MAAERILVVEDEPVVALDLQQTLREMGHDVVSIRTSFKSSARKPACGVSLNTSIK